MAIHNMKSSLEREQRGHARSNRFYIETLHASNIRRIVYDSAEGKKLQQQDIDLFITIDGREVSVSEKDRDSDFNDLLLEFYSIYPSKRGWMDNSEADILAYFTPTKLVWINKHQLVKFYKNHLRNLPVEAYFDCLKAKHSTRCQGLLAILGCDENVNFIAAYNPQYITMSVALSFDIIRRAGVEFKVYQLNKNL